MIRRHLYTEVRITWLATLARRLAIFSLPVIALSIALHRLGLVEYDVAYATLTAGLALALLAAIVAVAAFNLVSMLVMTVTDKQSDIAILRTLGATPRSIMAVFMVQGSVIGVVGTALGLVLGIALALNVETVVPVIERLLGFQVLPPDVYYINTLPSDLQSTDVVRIGGVALVLSLLSTVYPAWRAARTQPAEALRYE